MRIVTGSARWNGSGMREKGQRCGDGSWIDGWVLGRITKGVLDGEVLWYCWVFHFCACHFEFGVGMLINVCGL